MGEIVDLYDAISNVSSRLDISKAHGIRSIKTFDNYLTSVRRVRNRCAHAGILFDYAATEALTTQALLICQLFLTERTFGGPLKSSSI